MIVLTLLRPAAHYQPNPAPTAGQTFLSLFCVKECMSINVFAWLWDNAPQRGSEKLLLLAMADGSGTDRIYRTNLPHMMRRTNESETAVRSLLVQLEADGAIVGHGCRTLGVSECYEIIVPVPIDEMSVSRTGYQKVPIPRDVRHAVFSRDQHRCQWCGATENLTVDHIYPERHGGGTELSNLQTLCRRCNSRKGARIPASD